MQLSLAPPTETTTIAARRVLVLAPHADDEVFGCGGLLGELAAGEAAIRVLYLTDSSGGSEVSDDQKAYAERRRSEARRGLDILGVGESETLAIPDGDLSLHVAAAADAIQTAMIDHRPDLVLSVSPCEITADHRAAFASLHRALSRLRGGTELDGVAAECRILLYEVNHPAYPDILVDVSRRIGLLTEAMNAHASQLELHNYREAALGMRHYRALSLPAAVTAAEGYREIRLEELVTHGLSRLVRALGGIPDHVAIGDGPLVSVIVRTKDRPELLDEALGSIAASSYRQVEVVLVNDGGKSPTIPRSFPFPVVAIDLPVNRGRAAAANAGVEASSGAYLSFLDDDDLMDPEHLAVLVALVTAADVRVAYTDAAVGVYQLDGEHGWAEIERRLPYSRDFDPELLLVDNYIPFNTLLIERSLFEAAGPFDPDLAFFEDWEWLIRLAAITPFHHLAQVTAEYRHFRGSGHHILGARAHDREDFLRMKAEVIRRHSARSGPETIAGIVDRLRGETVAAAESDATARRELAATRSALVEQTDAYHRLNGERQALRDERALLTAEIDRLNHAVADRNQLAGEVERLHEAETSLRSKIDEQEAHLARLYGEIDRLSSLIEAMEGTTAWRWHRRIERLKGRS
jgi:LmbE family N-acetylglucosaminyl deacetylase